MKAKVVLIISLLLSGFAWSQTVSIKTRDNTFYYMPSDNDTISHPKSEIFAIITDRGGVSVRIKKDGSSVGSSFQKEASLGLPYTAYRDGDNGNATFASNDAVLAWFDEKTGFRTAPGGSGASDAEDLNYDNGTSGLTATNAQDAIDELAAGGGSTAQDLSASSNTINITGGDGVDVSTLPIVASALQPSDNISELTNDAGYLTTETQDISLDGNDLTITGGSTITLPSGGGGGDVTQTGTQTLSNKTLTSPVIVSGDGIYSQDGNKLLSVSQENPSSSTYIDLQARFSTVAPRIRALGSGTNLGINLIPKGGGQVQINGEPIAQQAQFIDAQTDPIASVSSPSNAIGNGTADDATALQYGLYAANNEKKVLYLPAGTYKINGQITIHADNLTIKGAGMEKTTILIESSYSGTGSAIAAYGKNNVTFEDLTVTGNDKKINAAFEITSSSPTANNVTFRRVRIHDFWGDGIRLGQTATDGTHYLDKLIIEDCQFYNLGESGNTEITSQTFPDADRSNAINLQQTTRRAIITGNFIHNVAGDGIFAWGWSQTDNANAEDHGDWIISNNNITRTWMGIEINGLALPQKISITDNIIKYPTRDYGYCVSIDSQWGNISGNTFITTERSAIEGTINEGEISNNIINIHSYTGDNGLAGASTAGGSDRINGMELYGFAVKVFGNNITLNRGTSLGSNDPVEYNGIKLISRTTDPANQPLEYDGINDFSGYWDISGNTVHGFTHRGIDATNEKIRKVSVHSNTFRSRNAVKSVIWMQGYDWNIYNNLFDMTASTPDALEGILLVHSQGDDTKSVVTKNTIINDAWKFTDATQYRHFNNEFVQSNGLAYVLKPRPEMTQAQRTAISSPIEGTTVYQTDGVKGAYEYNGSGWAYKSDDYIRPQDYGAVMDGVTDDRAAFVATLAAAQSLGKKVLIDRDMFLDVEETGTKSIFLEDDLFLEGVNSPKIITNNLLSPAFYIALSNDVTIKGIEFVWDQTYDATFGWDSAMHSANLTQLNNYVVANKGITLTGSNVQSRSPISWRTMFSLQAPDNVLFEDVTFSSAGDTADKFMIYTVTLREQYNKNQEVVSNDGQDTRIPTNIKFKDCVIDGAAMGIQGIVDGFYSDGLIGRRYTEVQAANGTSIGGSGTGGDNWMNPPHLIYINEDSSTNFAGSSDVKITNTIDYGEYVGSPNVRGSYGHCSSLKLVQDVDNFAVDGYYSYRREGLGDFGGLTNGSFNNIYSESTTDIFDAAWQFNPVRFVGTLENVSFNNITIKDNSDVAEIHPMDYMVGNNVFMNNVKLIVKEFNSDQYGGFGVHGSNNTVINSGYIMDSNTSSQGYRGILYLDDTSKNGASNNYYDLYVKGWRNIDSDPLGLAVRMSFQSNQNTNKNFARVRDISNSYTATVENGVITVDWSKSESVDLGAVSNQQLTMNLPSNFRLDKVSTEVTEAITAGTVSLGTSAVLTDNLIEDIDNATGVETFIIDEGNFASSNRDIYIHHDSGFADAGELNITVHLQREYTENGGTSNRVVSTPGVDGNGIYDGNGTLSGPTTINTSGSTLSLLDGKFQISRTGSSGDHRIGFRNDSGGVGYDTGSTYGSFGVYLGSADTGKPVFLATAGTPRFFVKGNGDIAIGHTSPTALLDVNPSTTTKASLRIREGAAPTTPNDGDIWNDNGQLYIYLNGNTYAFDLTVQ